MPDIGGRFVLPQGPYPVRLFLLGRNPGIEESKIGLSFVGSAGRELSMYLLYSDINRNSSYISNLFRFYTIGDEPPSNEQLESHWAITEKELLLVKPEVLVTFGADATAFFFSKLGIEDFRGMDAHAGIPLKAEVYIPHVERPPLIPEDPANAAPWLHDLWDEAPPDGSLSFTLYPCLHPAAGLHKPTDMGKIDHCFKELARVLRGEVKPRDPFAPQHPIDKKLLTTRAEVRAAFAQADKYIGLDTEGLPDWPWGLTFSVLPWVGYAILAKHREALGEFRVQLKAFNGRGGKLIIHNCLHDLAVLGAMEIYLPEGTYWDTMIICFLLGVEPQGLKPQSYRLLDIKMQEYADVTAPYELKNMVEYLLLAHEIDWDACQKCGARRGQGTKHPLWGYENVDPLLLRKDGKLRAVAEKELPWCEERPSGIRKHSISKRLDRLVKDFTGGTDGRVGNL